MREYDDITIALSIFLYKIKYEFLLIKKLFLLKQNSSFNAKNYHFKILINIVCFNKIFIDDMLNDKETYYILYERHFKIQSEDDWIKSIFPIDAFSSWVKYEDIITFGAMVRTEFVNQNLNVEKIISDWFIKALNWNRITTAIYTVFDVV